MKPDPLLLAAAHDAQLDIGTMFHNFLENAVMWIDPGEVVVRTTWTYSHRGTEETIFPFVSNQMNLSSMGSMGLSMGQLNMQGMAGLDAKQHMASLPQPKLTSTSAGSKGRHYSPPKSQANSRKQNDHNQGKNNQAGFRRPSDSKNNNQQADLSLNVYSSVFVPSSNYQDYWSPHDRVGLTV